MYVSCDNVLGELQFYLDADDNGNRAENEVKRMRYKRKEPFRYIFDEPLDAGLEILQTDTDGNKKSSGKAEILNISVHGLRIKTDMSLTVADNDIFNLEIGFKLNNQTIKVHGMAVWKKDRGRLSEYGVDLDTDEAERKRLVEQLKVYAKRANEA